MSTSRPSAGDRQASSPGVDLYWLPLGAGGHSVRINGRVYEALAAAMQRRPRSDLYHSALQVHLPGEQFVIEQAPVPDLSGPSDDPSDHPDGARSEAAGLGEDCRLHLASR